MSNAVAGQLFHEQNSGKLGFIQYHGAIHVNHSLLSVVLRD